MLDHIQIRLKRIHSSLFALQSNTDTIYKYLQVLALHILNPMVIHTEIMCSLLQNIQTQMAHNPRLRLFDDVGYNIWEFYENVKVTPIVMEDFLMVILTIPLVNESLQMNLYKVHNLPLLHPDLQIEVTYDLEGEYFATLMQGMFMALIDTTNTKLCMVSQGCLCMFDQTIYPLDTTPWCMYALFTNNLPKIRKMCHMKLRLQNADLVYSLDGYIWAIISLTTTKFQIRCLRKNTLVEIKPPLQIVDIGNGCEGCAPNLYIPVKTELTATMVLPTQALVFLQFNF